MRRYLLPLLGLALVSSPMLASAGEAPKAAPVAAEAKPAPKAEEKPATPNAEKKMKHGKKGKGKKAEGRTVKTTKSHRKASPKTK